METAWAQGGHILLSAAQPLLSWSRRAIQSHPLVSELGLGAQGLHSILKLGQGSLLVVAREVWAGQGGGCQHSFPLCPSARETAAGPVLKHSIVILSFLWLWRS